MLNLFHGFVLMASPGRVDEVVAHARQIRPHGRQLEDVARDLAEAVERNLVVRETDRG